MPGVAENALEIGNAASTLSDAQTILVNLETTARCKWSNTCGPRCLLNQLNSRARPPLTRLDVLRVADEIISSRASFHVRHMCALGKEVMEDADTLFEIARMWHEAPASSRPGAFGIITASALGLESRVRDFARFPLSWIVISLDVPSVRLRSPVNEQPLLTSALHIRATGGTEALGVNTLLTPDNLAEVIALGRRFEPSQIDQWSLGPFLAPAANGLLRPVITRDDYCRAIERMEAEFSGSGMRILFDLDYAELLALVGDKARLKPAGNAWRYEYEVTKNIKLAALNEQPFFFLRSRWDGEILAKADFKIIGLERGTYGPWQPGRVGELLEQFVLQQEFINPMEAR